MRLYAFIRPWTSLTKPSRTPRSHSAVASFALSMTALSYWSWITASSRTIAPAAFASPSVTSRSKRLVTPSNSAFI